MVKYLACIAGLASLSMAYSGMHDVGRVHARDLQLPETNTLEERDGRATCPKGNFAPVNQAGPKGGNDEKFTCDSSWAGNYAPLTSMTFWQSSEYVNPISGIRLHYANGDTSPIYGTVPDPGTNDVSDGGNNGETWSLASGDKITAMTLYDDSPGYALGHIHIETQNGPPFDFPATGSSTGASHTIDVGGGYLYGVGITTVPWRYYTDPQIHTTGTRSGKLNIENLGFLFLNTGIKNIAVSDFQYTNASGSAGIQQPDEGFSGSYYNDASETVGFGLVQAYGVSYGYSFTQTSTSTFSLGYSLDLNVKLADIAEVGDSYSFQWSTSNEQASGTSSSTATSVTCSASGTIPPSKGISVVGAMATGQASFGYTSKVTLTLDDGTTVSYNENGLMGQSAYTNCDVTYKNIDGPVSDTNSKITVSTVAGGSAASKGTSTGKTSSATATSGAKSSGGSTAAKTSATANSSGGGSTAKTTAAATTAKTTAAATTAKASSAAKASS